MTATAVLARPADIDQEAIAHAVEEWAARTAAPGDWFDEAAAAKACAFFPKYLRHTEAEWAGKPFVLSPWQRATVRVAFGWKRADGTRRFRVIYIEIGRKNGKTEFAAGIALLILLGDGEKGGQVYSMAVDKDQAKLVFNKASAMVNMSPELAARLTTFKTSIWCDQLGAKMMPLSSTPAAKHGFSPTGSIKDELHEWLTGELADVVHEGMGARRQPLELEITTAGRKGKGYGWERHEHALRVLKGEIEDPELLPVIFAADPEDDWTDPKIWAKANPNLGISPKLEFLASECRAAQGNPRKENNFKRYYLNLWTEQVTRWIPLEAWKACSADPTDPELFKKLEERLRGRECYSGLDLASTKDTNALVHCFPPVEDEELWTFLYRCWLPEMNAPAFVSRTQVPWEDWERLGAITLTEGNITDYRAIKAQIVKDAESFVIKEIAIDRWNASQVAVELQEDGLNVAFFGQGFASMSAPSKEFERIVLGRLLEHGNHPVARWMIANVALSEDPAGNIKPDKAKSGEKIDLTVAGIMALGRATANAAPGESVYDQIGRAEAAASESEHEETPAADSGDLEIDWKVLQDPRHPDFAEMKRRYELWREQQDDED